MIRIVEPMIQGRTHVPVNAAVVDIVHRAFPHESICFSAEAQHLEAVRREAGGLSRVTWEAISKRNHARGCRGFLFSRVGAGDLLILTHVSPGLLFFIKGLLVLRDCRCQVILHSNLNRIRGWRSRNPWVRWQDLKSALSFPLSRDKIQYLVLESPIRRALLAEIPSLGGRVAVLEHPIPVSMALGDGKEIPSSPLTIGFVGLCSRDRGFEDFLYLADTLGDRAAFHAVGSIPPGEVWDLSSLSVAPGGEKLDRSAFIKGLGALDFICMPYPPEAYSLSASGVLLDAVAAGIPPIAYAFPILTDLVDRYGDIGHICASRQTMVETISSLARGEGLDRYRDQCGNLACIAQDRRGEKLAPGYQADLSGGYPPQRG